MLHYTRKRRAIFQNPTILFRNLIAAGGYEGRINGADLPPAEIKSGFFALVAVPAVSLYTALFRYSFGVIRYFF